MNYFSHHGSTVHIPRVHRHWFPENWRYYCFHLNPPSPVSPFVQIKDLETDRLTHWPIGGTSEPTFLTRGTQLTFRLILSARTWDGFVNLWWLKVNKWTSFAYFSRRFKTSSFPSHRISFISSIYYFPQWQFCCPTYNGWQPMWTSFFSYFLITTISMAIITTLSSKRKRFPKRVGNDPPLFLLTAFWSSIQAIIHQKRFCQWWAEYIDQRSAWLEL